MKEDEIIRFVNLINPKKDGIWKGERAEFITGAMLVSLLGQREKVAGQTSRARLTKRRRYVRVRKKKKNGC